MALGKPSDYPLSPLPDPALDEDIRFHGNDHDYLVIAMVRMRYKGGRVIGYEPRRFYHSGKARRPAYWAVAWAPPEKDYTSATWDPTEYRTRTAAVEVAQHQANLEKTRALLTPKE